MAVNNHKTRSSAAVAVAVAFALTGCGSTDSIADTAPATDTADFPVITQPQEVEDYPTAEVAGVLDLEAGCLTLDRHVVFWPYGAAWDDAHQSVVFDDAPRFEDASPAEVGMPFSGGGAWFEPDADLQWLGGDVAERVAACVAATGATDVVYAYPTQ